MYYDYGNIKKSKYRAVQDPHNQIYDPRVQIVAYDIYEIDLDEVVRANI